MAQEITSDFQIFTDASRRCATPRAKYRMRMRIRMRINAAAQAGRGTTRSTSQHNPSEGSAAFINNAEVVDESLACFIFVALFALLYPTCEYAEECVGWGTGCMLGMHMP